LCPRLQVFQPLFVVESAARFVAFMAVSVERRAVPMRYDLSAL
jgi:hypothetical protein